MSLPSDFVPPPNTVRLDDFLKCHGLVGTGGEAKVRIQSGEIRVNSEVETRRRKQLTEGDCVEFGGQKYIVKMDDL
ncbi:MAG: RNA-binding S4 domain-containing protein [Rubripirellula sp.]|jgi:ribosome-associated protein|nr:RNA-binding S4 domain-containing protein [Rubripirellula sp.]MDA8697239.1 RNA-binding S4 domain-containing protein [Rhodopirellula sp.]MDA9777637.1 RNA-binding S4 domain-containing protein [Rubripirellula sp.]